MVHRLYFNFVRFPLYSVHFKRLVSEAPHTCRCVSGVQNKTEYLSQIFILCSMVFVQKIENAAMTIEMPAELFKCVRTCAKHTKFTAPLSASVIILFFANIVENFCSFLTVLAAFATF